MTRIRNRQKNRSATATPEKARRNTAKPADAHKGSENDMDIASILGIIIGFGCVAGSYAMGGGSLGSLWMLSAG